MKNKLRPIDREDLDEDDADELVETVLSGARAYENVVVPRTETHAKMRIVTRAEVHSIRAATRKFLAKSGFSTEGQVTSLGSLDEWTAEIAVRHLAVAMRDPEDTERALAPIEDWRDCDDDQIATLWQRYQEFEERLNPLRDLEALTPTEIALVVDAAKKKDGDLLMSFGLRKLAAYLISSAGPPPS